MATAWPDFSRRSGDRELIDDLDLDRAAMAAVWRDLDVINRWLGGYATTLAGLERLLPEGRPARLLEVAAGGGDTARTLLRWGRRRGRAVAVVAVDLGAASVARMRERLAGEDGVRVVRGDGLALPFADRSFDAATCSLFLHHLDAGAAADLLREMARVSRRGVIVNDLERTPLAWLGIRVLTRLLGACPIVRNDAPLSVLRGFRRGDIDELARRAGLVIEARRRWAFRWQLLIEGGA